jgi:hypothetical protein
MTSSRDPLDELLPRWADARCLSSSDMARVRAAVLAEADELDADWLWSLLSPVTALLDGPHPLREVLTAGFTT